MGNSFLIGFVSGITASIFMFFIQYWLKYLSTLKMGYEYIITGLLSGLAVFFILVGIYLFFSSLVEKDKNKFKNFKKGLLFFIIGAFLAIIIDFLLPLLI